MKSYSLICILLIAVLVVSGCSTTGCYKAAGGDRLEVQYACSECDTGYISQSQWVRHSREFHSLVRRVPLVKVTGVENGDAILEFSCPQCQGHRLGEEQWRQHGELAHGAPAEFPEVRVERISKSGQSKIVEYASSAKDHELVIAKE